MWPRRRARLGGGARPLGRAFGRVWTGREEHDRVEVRPRRSTRPGEHGLSRGSVARQLRGLVGLEGKKKIMNHFLMSGVVGSFFSNSIKLEFDGTPSDEFHQFSGQIHYFGRSDPRLSCRCLDKFFDLDLFVLVNLNLMEL